MQKILKIGIGQVPTSLYIGEVCIGTQLCEKMTPLCSQFLDPRLLHNSHITSLQILQMSK
ncbi:hypothetical protein BVRB_1g022100 [Beta vulgaris subsp. vulgaris]|nr:hypothetical protein BVRB_1g022100 [Beta vulgaris subsp. vulgaris]